MEENCQFISRRISFPKICFAIPKSFMSIVFDNSLFSFHKDLFIKITMQKCGIYFELLQLEIHTAANPCITQIEHIFTTYENLSSKLVPCFWPNPFTTNRVFYFNNFSLSFFGLNTHLFLSAFLPFGSSINLYVWFFHKEFIFSCMNFIQ